MPHPYWRTVEYDAIPSIFQTSNGNHRYDACLSAVFGVALLLALVRRFSLRHEDDSLHLHQFDSSLVQNQSSLASFLNRVDRLSKSLTVVVLLYGIALIARIFYLAWMDSLGKK